MPHVDLLLIGTGSGNSILSEEFAGRTVAIVERGTFGGTCLNVGCIPTKMFVHTADVAATPGSSSRFGVDETLDQVRWADIRDRIFGRIDPIAAGGLEYRTSHQDNAHVQVYQGTARFTGERRVQVTPNDGGPEVEVTADQVVVAAGGRPFIPAIDGLADIDFHTSDTIMRLDRLPRHLTVLGGGFVGSELAHVFSSLGVAVTVINRSEALLRGEDEEVSARFTEIASEHWDVRLNTRVRSAASHGTAIHLELEGPDGSTTLETDELLVAVGRVPNSDLLDATAGGLGVNPAGLLVVDEYQRTTVDGVWALGDICSPWQLKHVANHEARIVQHNLLHPDRLRASDHRYVPHAVFSSPQVASVGLTEKQARAQGIDISVARQAYADIAYGWAMEDTTGFAKLVAEKGTGRLLGAHIIGPQAPTLIQTLIQAMSFDQDVREVARGQYWIHPAMPELVENALLQLD
ncbi:mycothione reductase [Ruania halotolerans]|uniref:mycothione reductase n=1 Tax=Ruania halotolerans TaxID=2897773 RepID=UPI001E33293B|nr:mycothione reductase [Ruania halotolerans]UFU08033.1 mycothione reductase [Ruania halotolerans]